MKTVPLFFLLTAATLLGGCALMTDPEDRDFYGKGWIKPTELDTPPVHHQIVDPSHPQATNAPATRTASAPTPEPEWITPIPGAQ